MITKIKLKVMVCTMILSVCSVFAWNGGPAVVEAGNFSNVLTTVSVGDDVTGCLDANADNYNAEATVQGLDEYGNIACNYSSCDDIPDTEGCMYPANYSAFHADFTAANCVTYGGTACTQGAAGCLDANATNYDAAAAVQAEDQYGNLLCVYASCDDAPSDGCVYADAFAGWNEYFGAEDCKNYGGTACVSGCLDANATNFDPNASVQDTDEWGNLLCVYTGCDVAPNSGCIYPESFGAFAEGFGPDQCSSYGGTPCSDSAAGCLDANASNFDAGATVQAEDQYGNLLCVYASCDDAPSDGCVYSESFGAYHDEFGHEACEGYGGTACGESEVVVPGGCIDAAATNYDAAATEQAVDEWNNQLCTYASCDDVPSTGCMYATSFATYNEYFSAADCVNYGGTACADDAEGCMDANADNYDAAATVQGLDQYGNIACNYSSCDDIPDAEGCYYEANYSAFHAEFNAENCVQYGGTACTADVNGCIDANATNYDAAATVQSVDQYGNILCVYASCDDVPELGCSYAESFGAFADGFGATECSSYGGTPCEGESGCMDANATNYDAAATVQSVDQYGNILCSFASCDDAPSDGCNYTADGSFGAYNDEFGNELCESYGGTACGVSEVVEEEGEGCLDANADNYDATATVQGLDQYGNLACNYSSCDDIPDAEGCYYPANYSAFHANFTAGNCVEYGGTACLDSTAGCMDANASNYLPAATTAGLDQWGNSICIYTSCDDIPDAEGCMYADGYATWNDYFGATECSNYGGTPCEGGSADVEGCLDANADNYNADATVQGLDEYGNLACNYSSCDDIPDAEGCYYEANYSAFHDGFNAANCVEYGGTACTEGVSGCLDANATNYDAAANVAGQDQHGNSVCIYTSCDDIPDAEGCMYGDAYAPYNEWFTPDNCTTYGGTACVEEVDGVAGCLDANADNYNAEATVQGLDQYGNLACNYSSCDDIPDAEGCYYTANYSAFHDGFNAANCVQYGGTACTDSSETPGCLDASATNYDAAATVQSEDQWGNSTCIYTSCDDVPEPGCIYADGFGFFNDEFGAEQCTQYGGAPCANSSEGCLDASATNYDAAAAVQAEDQYGNIMCVYTSCDDIPELGCIYAESFGAYHAEFNGSACSEYGGTPCNGEEVVGCTDENATNYDAAANVLGEDQYSNSVCIYTACDQVPAGGGCIYGDAFGSWSDGFNADNCVQYGGSPCLEGCIDANASNYDAAASIQSTDQYANLLCVYASCEDTPNLGCIYEESFGAYSEGFGAAQCETYGGIACAASSAGCTDANASNYDASATEQALDQYGNVLCAFASCDDAPSDGCNYTELGSFGTYDEDFGHELCTTYGGTPCGESEVVIPGGCIDPAATDYDAAASEQAVDEWNNQLCTYASCDVVPSTGCMYATSFAPYNANFSAADCENYGGTACTDESEGCIDANADNYDADATIQAEDQWGNAVCTYASCDDIPDAEGCIYPTAYSAFSADFSAENCVTYGGTACEEVVATEGPTCQTLDLPSGWSMFSTYMVPADMDLASVLAPIIDNVIIAKNNDGAAYLVEWAFNGVGDLTVGQGYQIKTDAAVSLEVCGTYAAPEANAVDISAGWNMIGYLRTDAAAADAVLADINASGNLIIAKDYNGAAYLPEWAFNGIGDMVPGQGYQLKTSTADVLQFLSNDASYRFASAEVTENNVSHFANVAATGNNMTVVIEDAAWDVLPTAGAEIAAFDHAGNMIGSAIYSSPVTAVTVWGDDATTSSKDGLEVSEAVSFKVWTSEKVVDFTVNEWTEGSSSYNVDAINVASSIETNHVIADLSSTERVLVKVINVLGQEVILNNDSFNGKVLFNIYNDGTVEKVVK